MKNEYKGLVIIHTQINTDKVFSRVSHHVWEVTVYHLHISSECSNRGASRGVSRGISSGVGREVGREVSRRVIVTSLWW